MLRQVESYFVVHTAVFEISTENHEEAEREFLDTHRWFTLEELRSHDETLVPGNFAELLAPLLRGEYPANPVTVGIDRSRSGPGYRGFAPGATAPFETLQAPSVSSRSSTHAIPVFSETMRTSMLLSSATNV